MAWTEPQIDILRFLWADGKAAQDIADFINEKLQPQRPVTRNAVIGKIHRLGLSDRTVLIKPHARKFYGGEKVNVPGHTRLSPSKAGSQKLSNKIYTPPCWRLRRFAQFIFPKKAYLNVYGPLLDDVLFEYSEALQMGHIHLARWIIIRGYISFAATLGAWVPVTLFDRVRLLSKTIGGAN